MSDKRKVVQVVAALIWDADRFMICQRPANKTRAFQWEFVGGKAEEGETLIQALERECMEELGVRIKAEDIFFEVDHDYPDIFIHLTLFNAVIVQGEVKKLEHNDIKWITAKEIPDYNFCPADKDILEKIQREKGC